MAILALEATSRDQLYSFPQILAIPWDIRMELHFKGRNHKRDTIGFFIDKKKPGVVRIYSRIESMDMWYFLQSRGRAAFNAPLRSKIRRRSSEKSAAAPSDPPKFWSILSLDD